jgi:serine phosphatase RsbU (regulator of sigma subunit)
MSDQPTTLGLLLRAAPPDRLPEVAADHLRRQFSACSVEILLPDLTGTRLQPLIGEPQPADTVAARRCFASRQPGTERVPGGQVRLHLPLTCWGECVGVLSVELPVAPAGELSDRLTADSDDLASALRAAGTTTDRYHRARRRGRLTMAAELQWDLLPGRALGDDRFLVAGQLEPAYDVRGDHFDWALNDDLLTLTVLNGHGDGMEAALLTSLAVNAMRNARRFGADIVEQAELASEAIHSRYSGSVHAATVLLEIDLVSGMVAAVDAGSPHCLIARGSGVEQVPLEQQLPLGMFAEAHYQIQQFYLEPGDRMLVVSDGVHAASPGGLPRFGESGLLSALRGTRLQPAGEAVGTVMRGLRHYHAGVEPDDDAVMVCLDWRR